MTGLGDSPVAGSASFDASGIYRYRLTRRWDPARPSMAWIMLNPSTANARSDDPTIRRVIGFSRTWGFGMVEVVNLFALRASDPRQLTTSPAPVGPGNDRALVTAASSSAAIVVAWGDHGAMVNRMTGVRRCEEVLDLVGSSRSLLTLGVTSRGQPRHPLYMPKDAQAEAYCR